MTGQVKDDTQAAVDRTRSGALAAHLPANPTQAGNLACMERAGRALFELALAQDAPGWQAGLPAGKVPLWLEDALLLDLVPRAAVLLGEAWMADDISFVEVSIASARLQELVRRYGLRASRDASIPVIPVILPPWEQHSLAATLAAHRISRAGRRAVLLSGLSAERLARMPALQTAPAALIVTIYRAEDTRLRQFRTRLREGLRNPVTLISGGPGFEATYMDTGMQSGARCSINDPVAALRACGIKLSDRS